MPVLFALPVLLCPACNALASFSPSCPSCGADAADEGRLADRVGPYAPYSPVPPSVADEPLAVFAAGEDFSDANGDSCLHAAECPHCGSSFAVAVPLWPL